MIKPQEGERKRKNREEENIKMDPSCPVRRRSRSTRKKTGGEKEIFQRGVQKGCRGGGGEGRQKGDQKGAQKGAQKKRIKVRRLVDKGTVLDGQPKTRFDSAEETYSKENPPRARGLGGALQKAPAKMFSNTVGLAAGPRVTTTPTLCITTAATGRATAAFCAGTGSPRTSRG